MTPDAAILAMHSVARSIRELSRVPPQAAREAAENLQQVIEDQFGAETDPYGRPWAPLKPQTVKRKVGDARILRREDIMLDSLQVKPMSGSGLSVTLSEPYSAFHQIGTRDMVSRPLLPRAGMPSAWSAAIGAALDRAFDRWAEGAKR